MFPRLFIASIGGAAVTVALLLGMNHVTRHFKERDPTRYFGITDFIAAPEGGKPRPVRAPSAQPDRPQLQYERSDPTLPVERPSLAEEPPAPIAPDPELDRDPSG